MAGTRVLEYTWTGTIEIEVEKSGGEGDQEALDTLSKMLMNDSPLSIMDPQDETEEIIEWHDEDEEEEEV